MLLLWSLCKRWSCTWAGVTGRRVFLRLTRNSGTRSDPVSPAWAGSCTSTWTAVTASPETQQQQRVVGAVSALQLIPTCLFFPHQGQGIAPALLPAAACFDTPQSDNRCAAPAVRALSTAFQEEPSLISFSIPDPAGSGVCKLGRGQIHRPSDACSSCVPTCALQNVAVQFPQIFP